MPDHDHNALIRLNNYVKSTMNAGRRNDETAPSAADFAGPFTRR
jgi:hypothetical protein